MRPRTLAAAVACALLVLPGAASAAAPSNDARADAQALGAPPSSVSGTTVGATVDATAEPFGGCGGTGASVWYKLDAAADQRLIVSVDASGDLDAIVDVFRRVRSQATAVTCDATDKNGAASATFRVKKGESYLIRVAALPNSAAGTFHLDLAAAQPEPTAPGARLPARGATRTLDRVGHVADAFSARLRAGTAYRFNLASLDDEGCVSLSVYAPGSSFDDDPLRRLSCGGYVLFTPGPGESGRYSFLVRASSRIRGAQRYHLQVARAGRDDTAPGIFLHNFARVRGSVRGSGIDVVDLYRFDVTTRSTLFASLATGGDLDLVLLRDDGRRLACACEGGGDAELHRGLRPGRYFLAVRAEGASSARYTLRRASRTITKSKIQVEGQRVAQVSPGSSVRVAVVTSPSVSGPVTITVERFDPLSGWQFVRRYHSGGSITFTPPAVGKYRFRGSFDGTRGAAPSETGYARLTVAGPLVE
ncbi:MAG TPA: hypothetical protein VNT55_14340 [Baekduia sp.]|nr:hypothetical protein [Baekduia sp.]